MHFPNFYFLCEFPIKQTDVLSGVKPTSQTFQIVRGLRLLLLLFGNISQVSTYPRREIFWRWPLLWNSSMSSDLWSKGSGVRKKLKHKVHLSIKNCKGLTTTQIGLKHHPETKSHYSQRSATSAADPQAPGLQLPQPQALVSPEVWNPPANAQLRPQAMRILGPRISGDFQGVQPSSWSTIVVTGPVHPWAWTLWWEQKWGDKDTTHQRKGGSTRKVTKWKKSMQCQKKKSRKGPNCSLTGWMKK